MRILKVQGGRASRLDIAIDDYSKSITGELFGEALREGNFKYYDVSSYTAYQNGNGGWTYTMGSRQSDRYVRYYNKGVESEGRIDSYRLEVELKGGQALGVFDELCECVGADDMLVKAAGYCIGAIELVDRGADVNISRCPRLSWWDEFCCRVGTAIRYKVESLPSTIFRSMEWISRSVTTTIATIFEAMGADLGRMWLDREISKGATRLDSRHWARVETYQARRRKGNVRMEMAL
jgi:DNA relaxase NicK